MPHSAFPVDHDHRQCHREQTLLLLSSPSKTTFHIDPQPHSIPFPKKLFRRVPSCPSLNSLHKFPKKVSMKFRERLSLVQQYRANLVTPYNHDYRREGGTSPVPTLLGRESEDGINATPRTSASESDSGDEVTVVGCNDRDEEDEEDAERTDALHKIRYRISNRKILQHVPGFSDEEEDIQAPSQSHDDGINSRAERRHSLASPIHYQGQNEVFWGLRATPYQSRVDLLDHHRSSTDGDEAMTELRPPPWHKPRQTKVGRNVPEKVEE